MKKKMLAMLCAAATLFTAAAPAVSAAETPAYQLGDLSMDGKVDTIDARLLLNEAARYLAELPGELTEEQIALGNVDGKSDEKGNAITSKDALLVLDYHVATHLAKMDVGTMEEFVDAVLNHNQYILDRDFQQIEEHTKEWAEQIKEDAG